jgi:hypothetical protein
MNKKNYWMVVSLFPNKKHVCLSIEHSRKEARKTQTYAKKLGYKAVVRKFTFL